MPDPYNIFQGNDVFLSGGQPVMPANAIAAKLREGNFGPFPNQSAPPGYVLPQTMDPGKIASALRSNILPNIAGGGPPVAPQPAAPPQPLSFMGTSNNPAGMYGAYGMGLGGLSDASRGWTPGMDANGWAGMFGLGMGANEGSPGLGGVLGLLGLGDVGMVGYDAGSAGGPGAHGAIGGGGGQLE